MAESESVIIRITTLLPCELRLLIYHFMFSVDWEAISALSAEREFIRANGFTSYANCLKQKTYRDYQSMVRRPSGGPSYPFLDEVEVAFHEGLEAFRHYLTESLC